jgi:hypothetical protein
LRKGHIAAVVLLEPGPDDALVKQGKAIFAAAPPDSFDGFEVWDLTRMIYVHPDKVAGVPSESGGASPP